MNAFAKIAKTAAPKSKKTDKVVAEVSDLAKENIDKFVANKATIAQLTSENKSLESVVIEEVFDQQRTMAVDSGEYVKTFSVPGKTKTVTYITTDKFSVPQDAEILEEVKKLIGAQKFNAFFVTRQTISLKEKVVEAARICAVDCAEGGNNPVQECHVQLNKHIFALDAAQKSEGGQEKNK